MVIPHCHFLFIVLSTQCSTVNRVVRLKMAILWDVVPCSLIDTDRRFGGAECFNCQDDHPDDGGSKHS
jgi:hypothetical protein